MVAISILQISMPVMYTTTTRFSTYIDNEFRSQQYSGEVLYSFVSSVGYVHYVKLLV